MAGPLVDVARIISSGGFGNGKSRLALLGAGRRANFRSSRAPFRFGDRKIWN